MKSPIYLLLAICLPLLSCSAQQFYSSEKEPAASAPSNPSAFMAEVLKEVNNFRQSGCRCGNKKMPSTHSLNWNKQLTDAAKRHALDIAARQQLDHSGRDGSSVMTRVSDTGYTWSNVAENIAFGYFDVKSVIQGWVDSKGHCLNMMNPDYKEVGVYRKGNYWVMVLATKM